MQIDFTKILLDFKSIPRKKRKKTFMEISGYPHYENVASNILKFYLDPSNEHGLKDLVLNSLLHLIDEDFQFDNDFEQIEVYREHKTIEENRLDLVILTDNYAIGIENKVKEIGLNAEFSRLPEAMEYRETLAILEKLNSQETPKTVDEIIAEEFPMSLTKNE